MTTINWPRVLLGGLVAGVVMTVFELVNGAIAGEALLEYLSGLGLPDVGTFASVVLMLSTFVYAIAIVFIYAAIRPRFGPGLKTAWIAGFVLWIVSGFLNSVSFVASGMMPASLPMLTGTLISLVEYLAAAAAGAWIYKEA